MSRRRAGFLAAGLIATLGLATLLAPAGASATPGTTPGAQPVAGSPGGGDPYFPKAGNGGYQVRHYGLALTYVPRTKALRATATISATAATSLSSFYLDLRGLKVTKVSVNSRAARFTQKAGELRVTPVEPLAEGRFVVKVSYGGKTGQPVDNTGGLYGWVSYADGAFTANEPEGASTWYPVNDVPTDKATYDFTITVPKGTTAVGNGLLVSRKARARSTTFHWATSSPTASYLTSAASGNYTLTKSRTADGLPIWNAVDKNLTAKQKKTAATRLALQPSMISFYSKVFGAYPFESFGAVIDDDEDAGYALENQTRPIYAGVPSENTIAHELSHQWFGDSVTPERWRDIWLNEGFATYAEWLWAQHRGGKTLAQRYAEVTATPAGDKFWKIKAGDPGAKDLFADATYDRGGAFLVKLRSTIGADAFGTVLQKWTAKHRYGNATTADLLALTERVSGQQLAGLFDDWLYTATKPAV